MRTICFIVTSYWAYGELTIALEFARRLSLGKYKPLFLIPPSHEEILKQDRIDYLTLVPKSRKLNLILLHEIKNRYDPAAVVLADFFNYHFCERHYGLTVNDLEIFRGKLGTFDIYEFQTTGGRVDTYGFLAANMRGLTLEAYDFLLQPCPVNHFKKKNNKEFRYSLLETVSERTEEKKQATRNRLGIGKDEKIILTTSAIWQKRYRLYEEIVPFIEACHRTMETVFEGLPGNVRVISVGSQVLFTDRRKDNFTHYDKLLPDRFRSIVEAADLYISNNYISTSMVKIVLSGVPTLLVQNSILKRKGTVTWFKYKNRKLPGILENCPVVYPFRMFPPGWYRFLKHIVTGNPFYSLMEHSELFTPAAMKKQILELLSLTWPSRLDEKRKAYLENLEKLPSVAKDFVI